MNGGTPKPPGRRAPPLCTPRLRATLLFLVPCSLFRLSLALTDDDHRRAQDAAAQLVPLLDDADDLAVLALTEHYGFVDVRVERLAVGRDLRDAAHLQQRLELAVDEADAVQPGEAGKAGVDVLQRPLQVVDDGQEVDDQGGVGQARQLFPLLLHAALEVLIVGRGPLPGSEVRLRLLPLLGQLRLQRLLRLLRLRLLLLLLVFAARAFAGGAAVDDSRFLFGVWRRHGSPR